MRALAAVAALLAGACVTEIPVHRPEPSSFKVEVVCAGATAADCAQVAPDCLTTTQAANLGTPEQPVDASQRFYLARVSALDEQARPDPTFAGSANVYVMFDGNTTPARNANTPPLLLQNGAECTGPNPPTSCWHLPFTAGKACLQVTIPPAFNKTALWVEDAGGPNGDSYATGASDAIYRPAPLITDVQANPDPKTFQSPLDNKHIEISGGTATQDQPMGAPIVVTGVFAQYFTVTDTGVPDSAFASLDVYSYSQPTVKVGDQVYDINGTLSEFHGLSELNFPIWSVVTDPSTGESVPAAVPPAHLIAPGDIGHAADKMDPWESGLVEAQKWKVCDVFSSAANKYDAQGWTKYQQWKIAPALDSGAKTCSDSNASVSVDTHTTLGSFDPSAHVGDTICDLKGILSVVIPGTNIYLWLITPRGAQDLDVAGVVKNPSDCP